jgi:Ala-tRNA(Pro) deacylase
LLRGCRGWAGTAVIGSLVREGLLHPLRGLDVSTLSKILSLLETAHCPYVLLQHAPVGETAAASRVRGHDLREAAKSLVLEVTERGSGNKRYYLVVVPGDKKVDLKFLKTVVNARRIQLAPEEKARELTGCVMGAVPPFTFNDDLTVILDMTISETERVVFNAGELYLSIMMKTVDFLKIIRNQIGYYCHDQLADVH